MKRLTYISKASDLTPEQLDNIAEISILNNERNHVTGVLLYLKGLFFQIIEGEEIAVDTLYEKILADERHTEVLCLRTEYHIEHRSFPEWAMKTINLDQQSDLLLQAIKTLLQTITDSHRILEKYTQPSVIRTIRQGINPLTVEPRLVEKIIFFSDVVSFSTFTEKLPIQQVVALVNDYLTLCTTIITAYRGEINKFIGDGVMASFDKAHVDAALQASIEILHELNVLRERSQPNDPRRLLYTGIGLSLGTVIEGNMGTALKMDYTLLGDAVNAASRLESLTRQLPWSLIFSDKVKQLAQAKWPFVSLGSHQVKGKQEPIEIYTVDEVMVRIVPTNIVQTIKQFCCYPSDLSRDSMK